MKNFQTTINVLSHKEDNEELDIDNPSEQTIQNISSSSWSFLEMPNKEKRKDTSLERSDDQTTRRKILSQSEGGGDNSSSSSKEE